MEYDVFSRFYDCLTFNIDYEGRTEYLIGLFEKYGQRPQLLLDMACGTGGFSIEFKKRGIDVIGVDLSADMLSIAQQKAFRQGLDIMLVNQRASELELYGHVDGAVCCLDSLNHITDYDEFCESLRRIAYYLKPQGLFIFDVNTVYKHRFVLSDKTFVYDVDDVYCVWQNSECDDNFQVDINLDFFYKQDGKYTRMSETFAERAYTQVQIKNALTKAGLEVAAAFGDISHSEPKEEEQRIVYITRRV